MLNKIIFTFFLLYFYNSWGQNIQDLNRNSFSDRENIRTKEKAISNFENLLDTDHDDISDSEDRCPNETGTPYFKGCPDTDGDGILDVDDACPTISGLKEDDGCPKAIPLHPQKKSNGIQFSENNYHLSSEVIESLKYVAILINDINDEFLIKGSAICTESKKIAKKRVRNVRTELIKNGVKKNKLKLEAFYSSDCENTNVEKDVIIKLLNS
ncbi:hypothetical protein ETU08_00910 [Apibacter muscae]|uniref:hypothetical protein n=1 Tax=Apibacter muscae TaxID=2509004 RepID=UPI0011ADC3D7|nr:hypothetical protein [Apibacter muscae]TWP31380.1 hypothetical protein ETU08_00910 [Apibacter muscae]